jgi:hypothetical protein
MPVKPAPKKEANKERRGKTSVGIGQNTASSENRKNAKKNKKEKASALAQS